MPPPPERMSPYGWLVLALAFAAAAATVGAFYGPAAWHGWRSERWPRTAGTVVESDLIHFHGPKTGDTHAPYVRYRYSIDGRTLEAARVGWADVRESGDAAAHRARVQAAYPVGATVDVFYDPAAPQRACLVRGIHLVLLWGLGIVISAQLAAAAFCAVRFSRRRREAAAPAAPPAP